MTETELLFTEVLHCNRADLYLNKTAILDKQKQFFIASVLKRRFTGEPLPYILGKTEFMGLAFKVSKDVLIPRPETEILVETVINIGKRLKVEGERVKILDLGTGSGCIAVSLAKLLPDCEVVGVDISAKALNVAQQNAIVHNVTQKIKLIHADLFRPFTFHLTPFTLLVSNPPYVPTEEIETLQPEIQFEPRIALDGGKEGLDFYHGIITYAPAYLRNGGFLILEMGCNQEDKIKNILKKSKNFEIIEIIKDYNKIERVIVAQKTEKLKNEKTEKLN